MYSDHCKNSCTMVESLRNSQKSKGGVRNETLSSKYQCQIRGNWANIQCNNRCGFKCGTFCKRCQALEAEYFGDPNGGFKQDWTNDNEFKRSARIGKPRRAPTQFHENHLKPSLSHNDLNVDSFNILVGVYNILDCRIDNQYSLYRIYTILITQLTMNERLLFNNSSVGLDKFLSKFRGVFMRTSLSNVTRFSLMPDSLFVLERFDFRIMIIEDIPTPYDANSTFPECNGGYEHKNVPCFPVPSLFEIPFCTPENMKKLDLKSKQKDAKTQSINAHSMDHVNPSNPSKSLPSLLQIKLQPAPSRIYPNLNNKNNSSACFSVDKNEERYGFSNGTISKCNPQACNEFSGVKNAQRKSIPSILSLNIQHPYPVFPSDRRPSGHILPRTISKSSTNAPSDSIPLQSHPNAPMIKVSLNPKYKISQVPPRKLFAGKNDKEIPQ